jgi:hypothetical protein
MISQNLRHQINALSGGHVRQPNKTAMRRALGKEKLPEVFVHRDEHAIFRRRSFQQHAITRVAATLAGFHHVVTMAAQPLGQSTPGAAIDQKPHWPATRTESSVSCAMTACA